MAPRETPLGCIRLSPSICGNCSPVDTHLGPCHDGELTNNSCVGALSLASYLLNLGVEHVSVYETPSLAALWNRGFGQVSVDTLIDFTEIMTLEGPVVMVLIANLPQLILSLLYTALNGMWTAMLVGVEWNTYGQEHKGLRTSSPVGNQRRTYWLSLPLVSASFFTRVCTSD